MPSPATLQNLSSIAEATRERLRTDVSTDALWSLALLDLAVRPDDGAAVERAIARLVEVAAREPQIGGPLSDLAIAHLVLSEGSGVSRSVYDALEAIRRARDVDSMSPAVRFNLAMVLDYAGLCGAALHAWQGYLASDSSTVWAVEAGTRLGRGCDGTVRPWNIREDVFDRLVPAWSDAVGRGAENEAELALRRIENVGEELIAGNGDSSVIQAARSIRKWARDSTGRSTLVAGLIAGGRGNTAFRAGAFEAAESDLTRAVLLLRRLGEPEPSAWYSLQLAAVAVYRGQYHVADSGFRAILQAAERSGSTFLRARASTGIALSLARQGRMARAEAWYVRAAAEFQSLHDSTGWGFVQSQLSEVYSLLGQQDRSWAAATRAVAALRADRASPYLHTALLSLGMRLGEAGLAHAAIAVLAEDVEVAGSTGRPQDVTEALARLGDAAARAGKHSEAREILARARHTLSEVSDPLMRARMEVEIARAEALAERSRDPRVSLDRLHTVERYFARQGIPIAIPPVLAAQSEIRLALGDTAEAERALITALHLLEDRARATTGRLAATGVLEGEAGVYRGLVALALARGDTVNALGYARRAHPASHERTRGTPSSGVVDSLPPGLAVLQYLALNDRLLIWVITPKRVRLAESRVTRDELAGLVNRLVVALERSPGSAVIEGLATDLHDRLVAPIAAAIHGMTELAIVPDRLLQRLPFPALTNRKTGRYLVEDFVLRQIDDPNAAVRRNQVRPTAGQAVLIAGNPDFDRVLFPGLAPLGHAMREADSIANLYPGAESLGGARVTRSALLVGLAKASLFHFAGHARSLDGAADRSHLVVAAVPGDMPDNVLYGADIAALDLRRLRLAIVSACGRGEGATGAGGLSSLAQAFVAAGAGGVVSSLWQVDDAETARLMVELHRVLVGGADPPDALRQAQLAAIAVEREAGLAPGSWAAFRYEGN